MTWRPHGLTRQWRRLSFYTGWPMGLRCQTAFCGTEQKLRELLQSAVRLYRIKGTKPALQEVIQLYTGQKPLIIEQFETASSELWKADGENAAAALRRQQPHLYRADAADGLQL